MRNYLESPEGHFHAYRKRERRCVHFWSDRILETKKSATNELSIDFQRQLSKRMQELGRQALTGAIIVELEFWAAERNPGEVHSLAKHYLDLMHRPVPGANVEKKHLLFRDDSQIEYLTCIYTTTTDQSGVSIRVRRLSDFFADIALLRKLENGEIESEDESWRDEMESKDDWDDRPIDQYQEFHKKRPLLEARYGSAQYEKLELIWKRDAQSCLLRGRKPMLSELAAIFAPRFHRYRRSREFKGLLEATSAMLRSVYESSFLSMDFGPRALEKGESSQFKARVRTALSQAKSRNKLLFPILTECAITILYLPPERAIKVDLDNLARKFIIPGVHEILKPPATPRDFIGRLHEGATMDAQTRSLLERWRNAPKAHIAYYQIFCLPRIEGDPAKGNVRLIIHDGDKMKTSWKALEAVLDNWADSMKR
jgi:Holliday junction resolvase RusA-like endonuclease